VRKQQRYSQHRGVEQNDARRIEIEEAERQAEMRRREEERRRREEEERQRRSAFWGEPWSTSRGRIDEQAEAQKRREAELARKRKIEEEQRRRRPWPTLGKGEEDEEVRGD
jgi:hypothetical protein